MLQKKKKREDGHATHNFVRMLHPERVVPLTFTASTGTGQ